MAELRDARLLRRCAPARAADDGGGGAPRPRTRARAEDAKIAVAEGGHTTIDLSHVERGLAVELGEAQAVAALDADIERIVEAARETARQAGVAAEAIDALYFTGGSTGLRLLAQRIAAAFRGACRAR